MMQILICEDDTRQREYMEIVVKRDRDVALALSTSDPAYVLEYVQAHPGEGRLYFLDIDLQHDQMNGIELGVKIREIDQMAKIVFVTTHAELAHLTFKHKISALDYIVKDNPKDMEARIHECIDVARERFLLEKQEQMKYFKVDAGGEVWSIAYDEILFFETHMNIRHRVILHTENGKIDFRGFIGEIEKIMPEFYRSHKSYLLNISKINYIDKLTKEAVMPNGKRALVAQKKMAELVRVIGEK